MKFQPDTLEGVNVITRLEPGGIWVGSQHFESSVLVPWTGAIQRWDVAHFDELMPAHFDHIVALQPELVIFGSGTGFRIVAPALQRALIERRIGMECMDTAAASRTYNVLANEGRNVVGALVLEAHLARRA